MTRAAAEKLTLGVLTAVLTAIAIPFVLGALTPKVSRAEFMAQIRENETQIRTVRVNVEQVDARLERILDVVCTNRAQHRSCTSTGITH